MTTIYLERKSKIPDFNYVDKVGWRVDQWAANGMLEFDIPGLADTRIKTDVEYQEEQWKFNKLAFTARMEHLQRRSQCKRYDCATRR